MGENAGAVLGIGMFAVLVFSVLSPQRENIRLPFKQAYMPIQQAILLEKRTVSELPVFTPRNSEQCWDSPLPCTPVFNADLNLRSPGDLGSGFSIDD
jgi:hypothetical protein